MVEAENGWVCKTHDLISQEWQVLMALGAQLPCRVPGPTGGRAVLAGDESTLGRTLFLLSWDDGWVVCWQVARNPSAPADALERLARHDDKIVRYEVAMNPGTSTTILGRLAKDEHETVRCYVAENLGAPAPGDARPARDGTGLGSRIGMRGRTHRATVTGDSHRPRRLGRAPGVGGCALSRKRLAGPDEFSTAPQ